MAKSYCNDCGFGPLDEDFCDEEGNYRCNECEAAYVAGGLLYELRAGNRVEFLERLHEEGQRFRTYASGVTEVLIRDASESADRGDVNEAIHLLRQAAEPKFKSLDECREAYAAAMAAKHEVVVA